MSFSQLIEESWSNDKFINSDIEIAVMETIKNLSNGVIRVAEKSGSEWHVNDWIKKAILLYFKISESKQIGIDPSLRWFDKVPSKFVGWDDNKFRARSIRTVPISHVREGVYIGDKTVIMPSFINIGAYVGNGCMVDTWATVGSCAQIGNNVHISGGAGIGGVLEPIGAKPVIIEDECFIGARSEIVEGMLIEYGSVISMGVYLSQSTKIVNRDTGEIHHGIVPSGSVVVPGSIKCEGHDNLSTYCAVIVKKSDERTKSKITLNNDLRDYNKKEKK